MEPAKTQRTLAIAIATAALIAWSPTAANAANAADLIDDAEGPIVICYLPDASDFTWEIDQVLSIQDFVVISRCDFGGEYRVGYVCHIQGIAGEATIYVGEGGLQWSVTGDVAGISFAGSALHRGLSAPHCGLSAGTHAYFEAYTGGAINKLKVTGST